MDSFWVSRVTADCLRLSVGGGGSNMVSLFGKHCSHSAFVNAIPAPSAYALCTTLHSNVLHRSTHSCSCGMLGLVLLGLCHMGCESAPASLRQSLLKGRRLLPNMSSVRRWTGRDETTAALRSALCLARCGRTTSPGFASSLPVARRGS
eukprot:scaffold53592_cov35-Tisochrysis_lutea.AAC.3